MSTSIASHSSLALTPTEAYTKGYQIPAGTVMSFAGALANLPAGWLHCDGASLVQADYQALYNAIGTVHGTVASHFNLPDLRGRFVRGWDAAQGRDTDAAGRTAANSGGATGDNVGSLQNDELKSHTHDVKQSFGNGSGSDNYDYPSNSFRVAPANRNLATTATGGNETRPKNIALMYIIKY